MMNAPVAVVTGASRGLGKEICEILANMNYSLIIVSKNKQRLDVVMNELEKSLRHDCAIEAFVIDLGKGNDVEEMISEIKCKYKRIDLIVNCAGMVEKGTANLELEVLDEMMRVNFYSAARIVQGLIPLMDGSNNPYIINISSRSSIYPKSTNGGYSSTKSALATYFKAMYSEVSGRGIRVTNLHPSYCHTDQSIRQKWIPDDKKIPPSDVALTIKYLLQLSRSVSIPEMVLDCSYVIANGDNYVR